MIGSVVTRLVPTDGPAANITGFVGLSMDDQRVLVASSVTFLAGIMQVRQVHSRQFYGPIDPYSGHIFKRKQLHAVKVVSDSAMHFLYIPGLCSSQQMTFTQAAFI